jgi:hypothetical protein
MKIFCLSLLFLLCGCASISGSRNQAISLHTSCEGTPMSGANCSITNDSGSWYTKTPAAVFIRRSGGDLVVICKKDQLQASATFRSSSSSGMWGNVLAGGLIGAAVDAGTGAGFDYPSPMNINFDSCPTPK